MKNIKGCPFEYGVSRAGVTVLLGKRNGMQEQEHSIAT
jgi:hypothetical protein